MATKKQRAKIAPPPEDNQHPAPPAETTQQPEDDQPLELGPQPAQRPAPPSDTTSRAFAEWVHDWAQDEEGLIDDFRWAEQRKAQVWALHKALADKADTTPLTFEDAALYLGGRGLRTVVKMVQEGTLQAVRMATTTRPAGKATRCIRLGTLRAYLLQNRKEAPR